MVFKSDKSKKTTAWHHRRREKRELAAAAAGPAEEGAIAHQNEDAAREDAHSGPRMKRRVG
jgi:hypothetical protein